MNQFLVSYDIIYRDGSKSSFNELTNETSGIWLLNAKRKYEGDTVNGKSILGTKVVLTFHQMLGYMAPRQHQELEDRLK